MTNESGFILVRSADVRKKVRECMPAGMTFTAVWMHDASFRLPDSAAGIEESAFEGDAGIRTVDAKNCGNIGGSAFADCRALSEIRLPRNCAIAPDAFANCGTFYVFAPADGTTETFCASREFMIFVEIR